MNIQLKTKVVGNYKDIMERFDRNLFEELKPNNAKLEILEFTGSKKGDYVHIRFSSPIKAEWISKIIEDGENEKESFFTDEGVLLPFPLGYWKHKHIVQKINEHSSYIIDDITFKGTNSLFSYILYPAIYFGFYPRKKIYQSYFKSN